MNTRNNSNKQPSFIFKRLLLGLAIMLGGISMQAQTASNAYIFYNGTYGYLINDGGNPGVSTTFNKNAIWVASGGLGNTSRNINTYSGTTTYYLTRSGTSLGFVTTAPTAYWRTTNNYLRYRQSNTNNYYLKYTNPGFDLSNTQQNGNLFTATGITINTGSPSNPTISITAVAGLSGGGIQLTGNVTGSYIPTYYYASVRNYNNNTNQTYYWTTTTDASTTQPSGITDWSDATKTWAVTTGGTYASVSSNGLVTFTANPTGNVVVTLTVSKGGYTGTQTFTLTRASQNQSGTSATVITGPTITPTSTALYYNEGSQTFTASASADNTTTTVPAHLTFTGGGNTYYYYDGTLYSNTEGFSTTTASTTSATLTWSLSGTAASYLTRTPNTGTSTTVTHTTQSPSDLTATLTVTASATGASDQTATATITAYGPMVQPTITRSGNTISIATSSTGASIYYTTDGSEPTSSSTLYTGPFDLTTSPTTVKAIAIRDGHSSTVANQTFQIQLPAPVITVSNTGLATIALGEGTPSGATIHYTTNGTIPTTSSPTYSAPVQLTNPQIIMAIVALANYTNSELVMADFISSGIVGTKVILDDRENHRWSYYSDASTPSQLHSLNPADVKITYYGDGIMMTGNNDYTASSTDYVQSDDANYIGGAKVNVGGDDENTFIYYKTLERENVDGTGRCPYKPIPNPFQVRPTYGSTWDGTNTDTWTGWRGFQCWRLKSVSGGSVYSVASGGTALSTGAVINAETEIFFAPTAEYGMEVELEAVWAIAYVVKANGDAANAIQQQTVGYERNFIVLHSTNSNFNFGGTSGKRITNINYSATVSTYYPDGTAGANSGSTLRGSGGTNLTLEANTKFENIEFSMGSYTITAANHDVIIGRGCTGTVNNLQGINGDATDLDYTIRLESGTFNQFCFVRSGTNTTVSGRYLIKAIMGCDYDRATGTNDKLIVSQNSSLFFAQTVGFTGSSNKDQKTFDCVFKSGTYQSDQWDDDQNGTNGYQHIAYLGQNSAQGNTYPGVRCVTVEGGDLGGMCGGRGVSSNSNNSTYMTPEVITFDLRIKGGTFHGGVFGGAADNPSIGSRRFIMTGGEIWGWLAGGCNGTGSQTGSGATNGDSYIYVGGTALVGGNHAMCLQETNGGQVFGAGRGLNDTRTSSVNYSYVAIADEAVISNNNNNTNYAAGGNVYGGSYNGTIVNEANVYILGGTVQGGVYGGSYGNATNSPVPAAKVSMTGGLVTGGVYGGSNNKGTVGDVEMHINGGQVGTGTGSGQTANIHGGGFGQNTIINGNVDLTLGTQNQTEPGVTVYGDVYGGSALGSVNGTSATTAYHTYVTLNKGIINGSLYGGALGDASTAANVYGPVKVKVYGGSVRKTDSNGANGSGGVYGANNINGAPQRSVEVDIFGTDPAATAGDYALFAVYGGGNAADYTYGNGYPKVTVSNCDNSIEYVYGGGNAAAVASTDVTIYGGNTIGNVFGGGNGISGVAADVNGNTNVLIAGGTIEHIFGGSNSKGNITGTINVTVNKDLGGNCPIHIGEVYGGGNMANSQAGTITIGCTGEAGETIDYVYGGANEANITSGNIILNITGGRINNVFGGNNTSGTISGTITVNVDWSNSSCTANYLGNVFGGGNLATYTAPSGNKNYPQVNILCGTVSGSVFGGGNGDPTDSTQEKGSIDGNPQVTIGNANTSLHSTVIGNVYGGGNAAKVKGNTFVMTKNRAQLFGNIYGGGNMAPVTGDTKVIINGTINQ